MENNNFRQGHLSSQALVVLSEAATGLHEALKGQRPFPPKLSDPKDFHNMSLVGSYGTHLLHSIHPQILQSLNHSMLANNCQLTKPTVLSNFQLPSAFSPPKYTGVAIDQNVYNGNETFRTDSASPTCTSQESMEGSNDYDAEKGESPRSSNSDPRDLRHFHSRPASSGMTSAAAAAAAAAAAMGNSIAAVSSTLATSPTVTTLSHIAFHHNSHHHNHNKDSLLSTSISNIVNACSGLRSGGNLNAIDVSVGITNGGVIMGGSAAGTAAAGGMGHVVSDVCPVCGVKLTAEEWNAHFLNELDRLHKLSAGMERSNLQATYIFEPPSLTQENAIRTSHNRWEAFQRVRLNRQNRLRIKIRKRKFDSDFYLLENDICNACPICKRKFGMESTKMPTEDSNMQEEIETVDVESCIDDVPDSGSVYLQNDNNRCTTNPDSMQGSHKFDEIDSLTAKSNFAVSSKENDENENSTNVITTTSSSDRVHSKNNSWDDLHGNVKSDGELSSYQIQRSTDFCGDDGSNCYKDTPMDHNDSDEDVVVDDDDFMKMSLMKKKKFDETTLSSRASEDAPVFPERPRSETQVTSTEPAIDSANHPSSSSFQMENSPSLFISRRASITELEEKSTDNEEGYTCFICKTGIKDVSSDSFFRGKNLYFHQSCVNVMSSFRLTKEFQHQTLLYLQQNDQ